MTIFQTILYILAVASVANIITNETIFAWFRNWVEQCLPSWCYELVTCPTCISVWITLVTMFFFPFGVVEYVLLPFVCSIVSKIISTQFTL